MGPSKYPTRGQTPIESSKRILRSLKALALVTLTFQTQKFCTVLVMNLARIHWTDEIMESLQRVYGTGHSIATPSGGQRPSHMAWSDFLADVKRANDGDGSFMQGFRPTVSRPLSPERARASR